jgi:hypothetical protein
MRLLVYLAVLLLTIGLEWWLWSGVNTKPEQFAMVQGVIVGFSVGGAIKWDSFGPDKPNRRHMEAE